MADETNPTDSVATSNNTEAGETVEDSQSPEIEAGDGPVDDSRLKILKRKKQKWHRTFESAFDTLMHRFWDFADDVLDSNEGFPEHSNKLYSTDQLALEESQRDEQAPTEDKDPEKSPFQIENESNINVSYRADIYYYSHEFERGKTPKFERSVQNKNPIRTIHTQDRAGNSKESVFEITAMYAIPAPNPYSIKERPHEDGISQPIEVLAEVGTYMTIRSKFVLDILRDVVRYHPSLTPRTVEMVLQEPFCMLLHHDEELARRRDKLKQAASESASPERNPSSISHEHIAYLMEFTHRRYADAMSRETARHRETRAMCTYDWVWLLFRPGSIVYSWDHNTLKAHIVEEHDRGEGAKTGGKISPKVLSDADDEERLPRPERLKVLVWTVEFDGERLGRRRRTVYIPAFDGEKSILSLPIFPKEFLKYDTRVHPTLSTEDFLTQRGKLFVEMARRSYREYHGETVTVPRRTVRFKLNRTGVLESR